MPRRPNARLIHSRALQRGPRALIEPGEGICHEPKESRSRMAGLMWRGHDAGIVARTEPGDASRRVIPAVSCVLLGPRVFVALGTCRSPHRQSAARRKLRCRRPPSIIADEIRFARLVQTFQATTKQSAAGERLHVVVVGAHAMMSHRTMRLPSPSPATPVRTKRGRSTVFKAAETSAMSRRCRMIAHCRRAILALHARRSDVVGPRRAR